MPELTYSNVMATLALFIALGGGAYAAINLPKNSVSSKTIRNGQVRSPDIRNRGVGKVDLKRAEPYHRVGANGQVQFSNGSEGDCLWLNAPVGPNILPSEPVSFFKDPYGVVHLVGGTISVDGPGGDGACSPQGAEGVEDRIVFRLPPGYRPPSLEAFFPTASGNPTALVTVVGIQPLDLGAAGVVPSGSVLNFGGDNPGGFKLDGDSFRAAGKGVGLPRRQGPAAGRSALRALLGRARTG
jgi:hypothetical protein